MTTIPSFALRREGCFPSLPHPARAPICLYPRRHVRGARWAGEPPPSLDAIAGISRAGPLSAYPAPHVELHSSATGPCRQHRLAMGTTTRCPDQAPVPARNRRGHCTMTKPTAPPKHLATESKKLWRSVLADYELEKRHEVVLLTALEALDRMRQPRPSSMPRASLSQTATAPPRHTRPSRSSATVAPRSRARCVNSVSTSKRLPPAAHHRGTTATYPNPHGPQSPGP